MLDRFADFKLITIECTDTACANAGLLRELGEVVEESPARIQLKVKRDRVVPVCKQLFDQLPIKDIDIEEVPIENIIGRIFNRAAA